MTALTAVQTTTVSESDQKTPEEPPSTSEVLVRLSRNLANRPEQVFLNQMKKALDDYPFTPEDEKVLLSVFSSLKTPTQTLIDFTQQGKPVDADVLLVSVKPHVEYYQYFHALQRIYIALRLLRDKRMFIVSHRLYQNLRNYLGAPPTIKGYPSPFPEMNTDFLNLFHKVLGKDSEEKIRTYLRDHSVLDDGKLEDLKRLCRQIKCSPLDGEFSLNLKEIHSKYSKMARELSNQTKIIRSCYRSFLFGLLPAFYCRKDVINFKRREFTDRDQTILPDEILSYFDLDLLEPPPAPHQTEIPKPTETLPLPPVVPASNEDPFLDLAKMVDRSHRSEARQELQRSFDSSQQQTIESIPEEKKPDPLESYFNCSRNISLGDLKRLLAERFGLMEGTRHTQVRTKDGRLVTVLPRHKKDLKSGTLRAVKRQVNRYRKS